VANQLASAILATAIVVAVWWLHPTLQIGS
jgi:hypothetical protein